MTFRGMRGAFVVAVTLATLAGCSGSDDPMSVTRPDTVPVDAQLVTKETSFGTASVTNRDPADERQLSDMACDANVVSVTTSRESVYAELACERMVSGDVVAKYRGTPVKITICPGESNSDRCPAAAQPKLRVESPTAGSIEFTTGHAWLEKK